MNNLLYVIADYFIEVMHGSAGFAPYLQYLLWATLLTALLFCLFGLKIYRVLFSLLAFFGTGIGLVLWLEPTVNWGVIVALVAVVGIMLAAIAYTMKAAGAVVMSAALAAAIAAIFTQTLWIWGAAALAAAVIALFLPKYTVMSASAVWGGLIIADHATAQLGLPHWWLFPAIAAVCAALGILLQFFMNRNAPAIQSIDLSEAREGARIRRQHRAAAREMRIAADRQSHSKRARVRAARADEKGNVPRHAGK